MKRTKIIRTEAEVIEQWKDYHRKVEKKRKANPEFERHNAFNVQCARTTSALVSIAEFGNPKASRLAKRILGVTDEKGQRIKADYGWLDCCPSFMAAEIDRLSRLEDKEEAAP
jgi:hypothetical protein